MMKQDYSFDPDEEMVAQLEREFGPETLRSELKKAPKPSAGSFFADFGRRWMERTIDLGERHSDRSYEVLKTAAAKTGSLSFPFIPERFIEIAYLGTQPIYTVPIVENSARALVFKMPFCAYFTVIREEMGEAFAGELRCRDACLTACRTAFQHFGFNVSVAMDATMANGEYCQFSIRHE